MLLQLCSSTQGRRSGTLRVAEAIGQHARQGFRIPSNGSQVRRFVDGGTRGCSKGASCFASRSVSLVTHDFARPSQAIGRLTPEQAYDRSFRLRTAIQQSILHKPLPKGQWVKPEEVWTAFSLLDQDSDLAPLDTGRPIHDPDRSRSRS